MTAIRKWADTCKRSPAVVLASAVAVGFFIGLVLRAFEQPKR